MATVGDILTLIEEAAPARLAADWDNVGLMVGRKGAEVKKAALALDPTPQTVQAAHESGAQLLLTHHPLFFRPLKRIDLDEFTAATAAKALELNMAIVSAHTNLDAAREGVSRVLAELLGLENVEPLEPINPPNNFKLTVFVPAGYENQVRKAVFEAGGGHIGLYRGCAFSARGEGVFTPEDRANPFLGVAGREETVVESRLEILVPPDALNRAVAAMLEAHPYEEVAYDIYPVSGRTQEGFGAIGNLVKPLLISELLTIINDKLEANVIRVAAPSQGTLTRVAVVGGSGGSYVQLAGSRGAEVLITGDIGYHQAREAENSGLCLIDAGHFGTEYPVLRELAAKLQIASEKKGHSISFEVLTGERDPWQVMEV